MLKGEKDQTKTNCRNPNSFFFKKSNTHPDWVNSCITAANPLTGCVTGIHSSCDIVRTRNQIITNLRPP